MPQPEISAFGSPQDKLGLMASRSGSFSDWGQVDPQTGRATGGNINRLQRLINERGLSEQLASQQYGITGDTMNWLKAQGVSFPGAVIPRQQGGTGGPNNPAGLMDAAANRSGSGRTGLMNMVGTGTAAGPTGSVGTTGTTATGTTGTITNTGTTGTTGAAGTTANSMSPLATSATTGTTGTTGTTWSGTQIMDWLRGENGWAMDPNVPYAQRIAAINNAKQLGGVTDEQIAAAFREINGSPNVTADMVSRYLSGQEDFFAPGTTGGTGTTGVSGGGTTQGATGGGVNTGTTTAGTTTQGGTGATTTLPNSTGYTTTTTGGNTGGTTLPGTPGLMDAITIPGATQASVGNITAADVQRAGDVTAGQGTAGQYTATTAQNANPVTAGTATAGQATTTDWTVDPRSTVQGQLADITSQDNVLNQMSRTQGLQEANRRGLMNSSMAVEAGQAALYRNALPIAQQDANTFASAGQFNAGAKNQASLANAQLFTDVSKFNVTSALQAGIVNQEQANKMNALSAEMQNRASEFNITSAADMAKFNIDSALRAGIINQEQANRMYQFVAAEGNKLNMFELGLDAEIGKFNASESNALTKLGMDSQTKLALANIEASYKTLMQTQAGAAETYKTLIGQMAEVLSNKDMDGAAKTAAIENLTRILNASLGVFGSIANINLPELDMEGLPPVTNGTGTTSGGTTATDTSGAGGVGGGGGGGDGGGVGGGGDGGV